jgi:hypothetical protein
MWRSLLWYTDAMFRRNLMLYHIPEGANFLRVLSNKMFPRMHAKVRGNLPDFRRSLQEKVNTWYGDHVHPFVTQYRRLNCLTGFHEIQCGTAVQNLHTRRDLVTIGPLSVTQYKESRTTSIGHFHICCSKWPTIGTEYFRSALLRNEELCDNRSSEKRNRTEGTK